MEVSIVSKEAFSVIGLLASGKAVNAVEWIQPLWQQAFARRSEIEAHVRSDAWGLMSGPSAFLSPWEDEGQYLAGWEIESHAIAPEGWHIWQVPPQSFATIDCKLSTYAQAFEVLKVGYSMGGRYVQSGAIHEYYPPSFRDPATDTLQLCMMVAEC